MPADGQTDEEWTRVKTKSRHRQGLRKPASTTAAHGASRQTSPGQVPSTLTVADIAAEYETFRQRWQDGEASRRLKETIEANVASGKAVRKAVCLGIGTFDPDHGGWDAKRRTYVQLVAFLDMARLISPSSDPLPCIFQEPLFSASDKAFIESLGHKVVETPAAFEAVDEHTLLFAVHMYRPIYEEALGKCLPAAFVGTGWDTWDDVGNLKEGDFARMREMHASHRLLPFPQDGSHTTFSGTCLYWQTRAADEEEGSGGEGRAAEAEGAVPVSDKAVEGSVSETTTTTTTTTTPSGRCRR